MSSGSDDSSYYAGDDDSSDDEQSLIGSEESDIPELHMEENSSDDSQDDEASDGDGSSYFESGSEEEEEEEDYVCEHCRRQAESASVDTDGMPGLAPMSSSEDEENMRGERASHRQQQQAPTMPSPATSSAGVAGSQRRNAASPPPLIESVTPGASSGGCSSDDEMPDLEEAAASSPEDGFNTDDRGDERPPRLVGVNSSGSSSGDEQPRPQRSRGGRVRRAARPASTGQSSSARPRPSATAQQSTASGRPNPEQLFQQHLLAGLAAGMSPGGGPGGRPMNQGDFEAMMGQFFGPALLGAAGGGDGFFSLPMFAGGQMDPMVLAALNASFNMAPPPIPKTHPDALEAICHLQVREGETIECPIASEDVEVGEWAGRLPCGHWFGSEAIATWLDQKNTCPVCRYELPTVDQQYNQEKSLSLQACFSAAKEASANEGDPLQARVRAHTDACRHECALDDMMDKTLVEVLGGPVVDGCKKGEGGGGLQHRQGVHSDGEQSSLRADASDKWDELLGNIHSFGNVLHATVQDCMCDKAFDMLADEMMGIDEKAQAAQIRQNVLDSLD